MPRVRFGDVVKEVKNKVDRDNNPYEYYVAGDHMDSENIHIHRRGRFATDDVGPAFIREFKSGQVLYGSRRTYLKKVAVAEFDGVTANTTFVLETKDESIFRQRLLPFIMLSDSFTKWSVGRSKGSTNPYVLFSDLKDFEFELPDIEEQDRLTEILWAADETLVAYNKALKSIDELVKSQFIEMFGDPIIVEKNDSLSKLGQVCILKAGKFVKANDISEFQGEGMYPCYGGNGLRGYVNDYNQDGEFPLIGRQGALCGNVQYAVGKFHATEHAVVVTPKEEMNRFWLYYLLLMLQLNRYASGAAQPGLAVNKLEEICVEIPSLDKQNEFSELAKQIDKSKFEIQQAIDDLNATIRALVQRTE